MINKAPLPLAQGGVAWSRMREAGGTTGPTIRKVLALAKAAAGVWWLPALVGLALGRAAIFGALLPFGTALCIALAAQGRPRRALAAALGAAVGGWTSPLASPAPAGGLSSATGPSAAAGVSPGLGSGIAPGAEVGLVPGALPGFLAGLMPLIGLLVALVLARRKPRSPWMVAATAAAAVAALRVVLAGGLTGNLLIAGTTGAAELAAALVLLPAAGLAGLRPGALSHGQVVSLLALAAFVVFGLHGVVWQGIAVAPLLARLLLLIVAVAGGPGFGAAAGSGLGIVAFLAAMPLHVPGRFPWEAAVLPPAGLLAGLGALGGKPGAIIGLLLTHVLLAPLASSGAEIGHALLQCLVAAACVLLVPAPVLRGIAGRLPGTPERERLHREWQREAGARAEQQLQRVAAIFEELGQTFSHQASASPEEEAPFERFVARVYDEVCQGCSRHAHCWDRHVYQTYRDLMATAAAAGPDGQLHPQDLAEGLRQRCIKPPHLREGISRVLESMRVEFYWRTRLEESRELVPRQLAGIAAIIAGVADQMERAGHLAGGLLGAASGERAWAPRFDVEVSVAQAPQDQSPVSGDSFKRVDLGPDKVAFILSDGMGTGPRAAAESQAAVAMLQRFLEAGFDLEFAVHTINTVLLLRSADETYATLDACVVDLTDGTVRMLKVGAAPSFLWRTSDGTGEGGEEVEVVRATSLPVGILTSVETPVVARRLGAGDLVVMVTDGVLEACRAKGDREEALRRTLERLPAPDVHQAVDTVFTRLRQRTGPAFPDDITIVAFQLTERGGRRGWRPGSPPGSASGAAARRRLSQRLHGSGDRTELSRPG